MFCAIRLDYYIAFGSKPKIIARFGFDREQQVVMGLPITGCSRPGSDK